MVKLVYYAGDNLGYILDIQLPFDFECTMSKYIFFSLAAGGKSSYALGLAHQTAVSGQEVRICVPTGLQAQAWRQRLAAAGGAFGVHVFTFDRLVAACLNAAREAYTQLSDPVQYRLLRTVIDQLPLHHYAPLQAKPGFIQVCQRLITELKSALITPAAFATAVSPLDITPRLTELADIYGRYQHQLRTENWADRVGLHWLAVEALRDRAPDACRDWPLLIVDGFDDFTSSQLQLVTLLANRVGSCIFTLTQAAVRYPRYQRTIEKVAVALNVTPQPLPVAAPPSASHPALRHLAQHLFARPIADPNGSQIDATAVVTLLEVADRAAEARAALRWLKQRIVWDGVPPNQVALLARDITPYRPFIRQIAAEFGLPIHLVDGQPLQQSPVIVALMALLRLHLPLPNTHTPSLPRRQVIAAWRSPYFRWGNDQTAITAADADLLDAFARQQLVIQGLDQWQAAFAAGAALQEAAPGDDEMEADGRFTPALVQQLQQKFDHFLATSLPPPAAASMRDFVQWLESLIGLDPEAPGSQQPPEGSLHVVTQARQNAATAAADVAALRTLKDILRGLVWAEAAVSQHSSVTYALFFSELVGAIAATHYNLPPQAAQSAILVAEVTQVRGLTFAATAVMGLSEGSFPATISEDPFLRDADRAALREQASFTLPPSTESAEREFFYEAVTRARDRLLLTRPILADNGADWVASPYWEAVRRLLEIEPTPGSSTAVLPLPETASWMEWWESAASQNLTALAADDAIRQHIETASAIWQMRQRAKTGSWQGDLSPLRADLSARFGPDHLWSASRLEAYRTCGYLFFLQSVLGIAPRPEPAEGLDVRQLGSVYHAIFEQVMAAGLPDPPAETAVRERVTAVAAPILDAAPAQQGFRQTPWWQQTRAEIIDNVTRSLITLAGDGYTFFRAEVDFGMQGPPLVLGSDDGDQLKLRGFIDRIDRRADGTIRIIDYKSGSKATFTPTAFQKGKKLQLPLYALAAREALRLGEVSDGFYWHFQQAERSPFQLGKVAGGVDEAMQTAVAHAWEAVSQIRSGHFAPAPPDGGCPSYCPAAAFCWQYTPRTW